MARQDIPLSEALRDSNPKINQNFTELYEGAPLGDPSVPQDGYVWTYDAASGGWLPKSAVHSHLPPAGHMQGANYRWDSATAYSIEPGEALVDGELLSWSADLSRTSLALSASTLYYVYLTAGPALKESTTAPVWDSANQYWRGADATRRCLSYFVTDGSANILRFLSVATGRTREFYDVAGRQGVILVNGGTSDTAWVSFAIAEAPAHATHFFCAPKIEYVANGNDAVLGISPVDLGGDQGWRATYTVRAQGANAGVRAFFGRSWLPIRSGANYYRMHNITGTNKAYIESHGVRFTV